MKELDLFYLQQDEPLKSRFLFLREHILNCDKNITEAWKFNMPFFCYKKQMFCYFHIYKTTGIPYIGFTEGKRMDHRALVAGERARIKILTLDPEADLPITALDDILKLAIALCESSL